jgi:hypothetical protein
MTDHRHIVTLFTEEEGKHKGILRIGKQMSATALMPLSLLQFQLQGREGRDLRSMSAVSLESHIYHWASDYLGLSLAQHWAELVNLSQSAHQEDARVFRLLQHCRESVRDPRNDQSLHLKCWYLEMWLLHLCGGIGRVRQVQELDQALAGFSLGVKGEQRPLLGNLLAQLFQQKIEDFATLDIECEAYAWVDALIHDMWRHFLDAPLRVRPTLVELLQKRRSP